MHQPINLSQLELKVAGSATPLIKDLTLTLSPGKLLSIFGPNGSGKTSLIRWLVDRSAHAAYEANQPRPSAFSDGKIAWIPQNGASSVMEWASMADNITLPQRMTGMSRKAAYDKAEKELGSLVKGLPLGRQAGLASGGEKQLIVLAREILRNADLIAIDEGFNALDYDRRRHTLSWVRNWCVRHRKMVLAIGHDPEECAWLSDAVLVLSSGPARNIATIEVAGPDHRKPGDLGSAWLSEATGRIQRAFREGIEK